MIYPNTQPSGVVGGLAGGDNKRKLQHLLSQTRAAPLFGGQAGARSVAGMPATAAPALSFNPFLKMLAQHPGETFDNLGANSSGSFAAGVDPLQGFVGSSVDTTSNSQQAGAAPSPAGQTGGPAIANPPAPGQVGGPTAPNTSYSSGYGHYNDTYLPPGTDPNSIQPSQPSGPMSTQDQLASQGIYSNNPLYHTLIQLAMYGQDY